MTDAMPAPDPLAGKRVLITAGPTYEDIDPVRFIGNRSSGKMGFAIAAAAAARGCKATLVAGPVHLDTPANIRRIDVRSAAQMHAAVLTELPADIYISAAAVADYTPAVVVTHKLKKVSHHQNLALVRTVDILAAVAAHPLRPALVVGFAAETDNLAEHAREKLAGKRLDLIAANQVGGPEGGFERDENTLFLYWPGGHTQLGPASKLDLAHALFNRIEDYFAHDHHPTPTASPHP